MRTKNSSSVSSAMEPITSPPHTQDLRLNHGESLADVQTPLSGLVLALFF